MKVEKDDETLWVSLAELFFLDIEPTEWQFDRVAELVKERGWTRNQVEIALIRYIAPNAGANLGFLLFPAIGEWGGFNQNILCSKINRSIEIRSKRSKWIYFISDWWCRRMLVTLGLQRLLERL